MPKTREEGKDDYEEIHMLNMTLQNLTTKYSNTQEYSLHRYNQRNHYVFNHSIFQKKSVYQILHNVTRYFSHCSGNNFLYSSMTLSVLRKQPMPTRHCLCCYSHFSLLIHTLLSQFKSYFLYSPIKLPTNAHLG